ncbi:Ornithine cyclodeaminase [Polaromonas sp. CG9_12]|nr:Ornithine cyclodeaminase [Polaromonas sp. CG9_12]
MNTTATTSLSTLFLSPQDVAGIVSRQGMVQTLQGMADCIRQDFLRWQSFDKSARLASHSPGGVIELMPIADAHTYTFKYVNGHPKNTALGLSTVMAFGVLADVATGVPLLVSELTLTTALRTAATSALAARALARPGSRVMALIGNGAQSEFQALAFHHLLGIEEINLYDLDAAATAKLMRNLQANPDTAGLRLRACGSTAEAVREADIVTTVTADKTHATIITAGMLKPGTHLNAVGGDCPGKTEIHADVMTAAKVFVEYEPQTRREGDLQQMAPDFAVTELWQVLSGEKTGRDSAAQITMFDSVGFALEDFSALRYLHDTAQALAAGSTISLIPRLDDPKNLYQLVRPAFSAEPLENPPSDPLNASAASAHPVIPADEKPVAVA